MPSLQRTLSFHLVSVTFLIVLLGSVASALAQATGDESVRAQNEVASAEQQQAIIERLAKIRASLFERQRKLLELEQQLKGVSDEKSRQALQSEIETLKESIAKLNASFEQVALGGLDLDLFLTQPKKEFDWKQELVEVTKPLFSSLNELTEKPRKIEELRTEIERYEDQLEVTNRALSAISVFDDQGLPDEVDQKLKKIATNWEQRRADTQNALELAEYQLASLRGEHVSTLNAVKITLHEFFVGRGTTLGIALGAAMVIWLVMRMILRLFQARIGHRLQVKKITRNRIGLYGYRLLTAVLITIAVMTVFYVRGDLLLLALSILALAMLALGLRQTLPRYIAETKLLLDIGPVRTGERIIWNEVPMKVKSINVNSTLENPDLEGELRLPLVSLDGLVSRPCCDQERWFPTRVGEFVLLPDGRYGQITKQTVEVVQVKILSSPVCFSTSEFQSLNVRNLSREGFGLSMTFGIDYRHQSIALVEVPIRLREALRTSIVEGGFEDDLVDVVVEFKEAAASSLDYFILLSMTGSAASAYFKLSRLVQQVCVEVCNCEGWVIPFSQITVNQGEGFDRFAISNSGGARGN